MTKDKPSKHSNQCRDLNNHLSTYKYNSKMNLFNCVGGRQPNTLYFYSIATCTMLYNRPEKNDQVLKTFVYCMAKLSVKYLFLCCG